ncbi:Uncharacterized protein APZ42_012611 [Daphnia magna]|uniref:Uncharacterized protein n=1 Tax=Daphnia magna TaxID=35525 RepID=A0A162RND9_9CRUS|nr:Uncharacterized protein APZ42_012611 [Daphnia magna]
MFSFSLDKMDRVSIGQHLLVTSLMEGAFNSNPTEPRYESTVSCTKIRKPI